MVSGLTLSIFFASFCEYFIKKRSLFSIHTKIPITFSITSSTLDSYTELNFNFVSTKIAKISSIDIGSFTDTNAFSTPAL